MRRVSLLLLVVLGGCDGARAFHCDTDEDCIHGAAPGRCEASGFCSFDDVRCPSGSRYSPHAPPGISDTCVPPPDNDQCGAARTLTTDELAGGSLRGGDTSGLLTCSPQAGADVFYSFDVDDCSDIELQAEAPGGNLALGLVDQCSSLLGCSDAHQTDDAEILDAAGLAAGSYDVAVAGIAYDEDFSLRLSIAPPPANDTCATASVVGASALPTQTLSRAHDDAASGGRTGGRDVFYRVDLAAANNVLDVTATPRGATGALSISLFAAPDVNGACAELDSRDAAAGVARFHDLAPGSYNVSVDGPSTGSCGQFDLVVSPFEVEPHNTCTHARRIGPVNGVTAGSFSDVADLDLATPEYVGSCGGAGNDVVYDLKVARRSRLRIGALELHGGFTPTVYLRQASPDCATAPEVTHNVLGTCPTSPGPEQPVGPQVLACSTDPSNAQLMLEDVAPGDYQIVVDSDDGAGAVQLTVDVVPPDGDTLLFAPNVGIGDCQVFSTVGAYDDPPSGLGCPATGQLDVYRTVVIPADCSIDIRSRVYSTTPQQIGVHNRDCAGMVDKTSTSQTDVCGNTPTLASGVYSSGAEVTASAIGADCTIQLVVLAADNSSTGYATLRTFEIARTCL